MKNMPNRTGLSAYLSNHEHQAGIIVCEKKKFIYMKPTKTAGTSILRMNLEKRLPGIIHKKDHPQQFNKWIEKITDEELNDYFIFSVVRNPWDRLVSVAAYFKIPFKKFVHNVHEYRKDDNLKIHSLPQHFYTHYNGNIFVDMFCRFESLQADINLVFDRIGIERNKLPYVNRSSHRYYASYYSEDEIKIVEDLYADDINYYGYMFDYDFLKMNRLSYKISLKLNNYRSRVKKNYLINGLFRS